MVAAVPGLPVIGNLLQLKEKKPYKTFTQMAHKHGPIYSIRTGSSTLIVLNTAQVAKEVTPSPTLFKFHPLPSFCYFRLASHLFESYVAYY